MATEPFPTILPGPSQAYSGEVAPDVDRTVFEEGDASQRKNSTNIEFDFNVVLEMSQAEFDLFAAFHRDTINNGADWFTMDIPFHDGTVNRVVRIVKGSYKFRYLPHNFWNIIFKLELQLAPTILTAAVLALLAGTAIPDLHTLLHVTIPITNPL